jgi:hypothetical protein
MNTRVTTTRRRGALPALVSICTSLLLVAAMSAPPALAEAKGYW